MAEWFNSSPLTNVVGIILIVIGAIIVLKLFKDITRPLFIIVLVVAAVLIFFNVLDLAFLAASGKKLFDSLWSSVVSSVDVEGMLTSAADSVISDVVNG